MTFVWTFRIEQASLSGHFALNSRLCLELCSQRFVLCAWVPFDANIAQRELLFLCWDCNDSSQWDGGPVHARKRIRFASCQTALGARALMSECDVRGARRSSLLLELRKCWCSASGLCWYMDFQSHSQ